MNAQTWELMQQLPSVHQFINRLVHDLATRLSVVVLIPDGLDSSLLWNCVRSELWRRNFAIDEISAAELSIQDGVASAIGQTLCVSWPAGKARTATALLAADGLPEILMLEGIERLPQPSCESWLRFVAQWAQLSQNALGAGSGPAALCLILPAGSLPSGAIEGDVRLAVHWWWGFPSALEMRLLCRLYRSAEDDSFAGQWRESILPSLVGSDVLLFDALVETEDFSPDALVHRLGQVAEEKGWSANELEEWELHTVASNGGGRAAATKPPTNLRRAWAKGLVHSTPEYGVEVHAAALPVLGREKELAHRLWRGQAQLVLPVLDTMRLSVCTHLTRKYSADWPVKWDRPNREDDEAALREDPLACQWGYLERLIRMCPQLADEKVWHSFVSSCVNARNSLAHYHPIRERDFDHLLSEFARFVKATSNGRAA